MCSLVKIGRMHRTMKTMFVVDWQKERDTLRGIDEMWAKERQLQFALTEKHQHGVGIPSSLTAPRTSSKNWQKHTTAGIR